MRLLSSLDAKFEQKPKPSRTASAFSLPQRALHERPTAQRKSPDVR
ncbi:hypothetical protein SAMN05192539_1001145 [Paraburkholderia diazotrophica]|uniref:Uncharacterized protein n=1 Tax=Paraburkholderia diazotrophica TaxID=667676 RepID=A0A1H6QJ82_9BURK|nr:hypothetical protein SAMN05192539_1001145 [Paraburkholderia diazotrophica]